MYMITGQGPGQEPSTPKKNNRQLDSTDCKKKSKLHVSMSAQKQSFVSKDKLRPTRTHQELSSDEEEDLKHLSKTIKKLHFDDSKIKSIERQREQIFVTPFEIPEEEYDKKPQAEPMILEGEDKPMRLRLQRKKQSLVEQGKMSATRLYRLNSMMVENSMQLANEDQYLGDNIYIKNILRKISGGFDEEEKDQNEYETSRFDQDYEIVELCGKTGTFRGNCFKCHNKLDRMVYFCKEIDLQMGNEQLPSVLKHQMDIYTSDADNHFVRYYQSWVENSKLFMIYQPATFTIAEFNSERKRLSEKEVRSLLMDMSASLMNLKEKKDCHHLNIKPENILNCRGKYKLMDMMCTLPTMQAVMKETTIYLAPQLNGFYFDDRVDLQKCDIFSLGVTILQNITEFKSKDLKIMRRLLRCSFHYSPGLIRLISKMISINPLKRPTAAELNGFNEIQHKTPTITRKLSL